MYIKTFFISFILLFTSCTSIDFSLKQDHIQLFKENTLIIEGSGDIEYINNLKLSNINIVQNVYLMHNNSVLTVEQLYTDSSYSFDGAIKKTIWIGFSDYIYSKEFAQSNVSFFSLKSKKDSSRLYLIAQSQNKKRIQLLYGKNEKLFYAIIKAIKNNTSIKDINKLQSDDIVELHDPKSYIKTTWSEKNIIIDGLVHKDGGKPIKSIK
ncbi:hypothetical protein [Sulfurimonas sp.]|uniref:hypothetical protein n=1 Tax=Sulfurimonas sp. TaxID=2022749 RepID=UPI003D1168E4